MKISILKDNVHCEQVEINNLLDLGPLITQHDWSPGLYKNNYRNLENFEAMDVIALDFDEGMSLEQAALEFSGSEHIIATSRSHQKQKHGKVCDRFRVVLKLDRPITSDAEYKATFNAIRKAFPAADAQCSDASRMFYKSPKVYATGIGATVEPQVPEVTKEKPKSAGVELPEGMRGKLARSTLEFITIGASVGSRNGTAFKAARDMFQNGFGQEEAESVLSQSPSVGGDFTVSELKVAIASAYAKPPKHEPRISAEEVQNQVAMSEAEEMTQSVSSIDLLDEACAHLENPLAAKGISTGWKAVDEILGGLRQAELGVVHAYPKTGKTVFITNLIANLTKQGHRTAFASLEMHPAKQVEPDLYSILLAKDIRKGKLSLTDRKTLLEMFAQGRGITYYKRVRRPSVEDIAAWCKKEYALGTRFFFIDHFHKMVKNEESLGDISRTISAISAIKYELPESHIILIIQPTKEGDFERRVSRKTLRGGAVLFDEVDYLINLHNKYQERRVVEVPWGEKVELSFKAYPPTIRELEFDAIRAKPFSNNMGAKVYMEYNPGTTRMEPSNYLPPQPEKVAMKPRRQDPRDDGDSDAQSFSSRYGQQSVFNKKRID